MLAFSHPNGPATDDAVFTLRQGLAEFSRIWPSGSLAILLATPTATYVSGNWKDATGFPNARPVNRA